MNIFCSSSLLRSNLTEALVFLTVYYVNRKMILLRNSKNIVKISAVYCPRWTFVRYRTLDYSPNAKLNKNVTDRYMCLPIPECKSQVSYIWIDGTGEHVRSKSRTLNYVPASHKEIPTWTFNGHATRQAEKKDSDVFICPVAMYNDPIRRGNNRLVLCDTYQHDHKPSKTNHRNSCMKALNTACDQHAMFGIEQKYHLMDLDDRPFGWPVMLGEPAPTSDYYCGVGASRVYGRDIAEAHYRACLYAGIELGGINPEVNLSQWEFQIGVTEGIKAADDLWMARFLLWSIAEEYGVGVTFRHRILCNWRHSSCHMNFSTKAMRADNGIEVIKKAISKLKKAHDNHLKAYSSSTAKITDEKFSQGVADRNFSVRIPRIVAEKKKGWLEDRRPPSDCDPYKVITALVNTCLLQ